MLYHKPAQVNQVFCHPLIKYNRRFILLVYRYIRSFPRPIRTPGTGYVETCLVPRPHYSARPKRFGSRGPIENVRPRQKS